MMNRIHPIIGSISSQIMRGYAKGTRTNRHPFITISQQPGTRMESLAGVLTRRLEQIDPGNPPWTAFDKNLVDKVAADYHMSKRLIESIEERSYDWLHELFKNFTASSPNAVPEDVTAYHRVAKTMWSLAQGGRVVLVGRAGVFVTAGLSHGIHLRIVAPLEMRAHQIQNERGLSKKQAHQEIEELDARQHAFFERFWPGRTLGPETFTATYNTAYLDEKKIADSVVPLVNTVLAQEDKPAAKSG